MKYEVIRPFYLYQYNVKNGSNKARRFEIGDIVSEAIRNRIQPNNRDYYTQ